MITGQLSDIELVYSGDFCGIGVLHLFVAWDKALVITISFRLVNGGLIADLIGDRMLRGGMDGCFMLLQVLGQAHDECVFLGSFALSELHWLRHETLEHLSTFRRLQAIGSTLVVMGLTGFHGAWARTYCMCYGTANLVTSTF